MEFYDKNLSWIPPENYKFSGVTPDGAFLRVQYRQPIFKTATRQIVAENIMTVFVNDQGREVARTWVRIDIPQPAPDALTSAPVARRFRIWNGFLIILEGVREMILWPK